ncbi:hypothetical protein BD847_2747 [Flavobacterium cutihirudinis]|uniref:HMA domain-containing protein n=1 Tax=Flavobacterium cutihirudinis TaxID=1265740 RepID=A0A3D9FUQ1_9FLAO|nr:hypothetical protein [Flavobacterium cutihirudinis]RED23684.1 hypothetical protein BD847_2747 [Flavobacterium cutihirudinis]
METDLNTIHIFKTNISAIESNCPAHYALNNHQNIAQWSVDCEDVDCVLRVVSETLKPQEIIKIISDLGFECQELS